jgi:DHA2 family multidrug resistance protein
MIARRAQVHQMNLAAHTNAYSPAYGAKLAAIARAFEHTGSQSATAVAQATGAMYRLLVVQATQLAYLDALKALAFATACMVPLVWVAKRPAAMNAPAGH